MEATKGVDATLGERLRASLHRSLQTQHEPHHTGSSRHGWLLQVHGRRLCASPSTLRRKRPREGKESECPSSNQQSSLETPVCAENILLALNSFLQEIEEEADPEHNASTASTSSQRRLVLETTSGIELRHCGLQAQHLQRATPVRTGTSLRDILVSPHRLWNRPAPCVTPSTTLNYLSTLDLEGNELGDQGLTLLCAMLATHFRGLQSLLLASNGITAVGFAHLAGVAAPQGEGSGLPPQLQTLGLSNNPVGRAPKGGSLDIHEEDKWCEAVQNLFSPLASTLRRVHLNHTGLNTHQGFCLLHRLFRFCFEGRRRLVFDHVYLRENALLDCAEVQRMLEVAVKDTGALTDFLQHHVSL